MTSEEVIYLHGDLNLKIVKARALPNMDLVTSRVRRCLTICEACTAQRSGEDSDGSKKVRHHRKIITSDPYVTVSVPQATVARTRVVPNAQDPEWNEQFNIPLAYPAANLEFHVKDNDVFGAQLIGRVLISAERVASGETIRGWFPVVGSNGNPPKHDTALYIDMKFMPCESNPLYQHGLAADPEHGGVRHTYFPLRKGCSVKLYQDAHISNEVKLPEIELDGGKFFEHGKCWEDLCYAISEAHHLIYMVGWSIYHKVKLVREPTRPLPRGDLTLGELLRYKSQEGVRVLLLIWDDKTSHDKFFFKTVRKPTLMHGFGNVS